MTTRTVAAYVRVSSRGQNAATQRAAIETAARARGDTIGHWYAEKQSATRLRRPELDALREAVRRGELGRVYVFRLDRLSRTGIRDMLQVVDEFRSARCELVNLADGFSVEGPGSDIVIAVMAGFAQMEREALGERVAAARARVEREGGHWGRPRRVGPADERRIRELAGEIATRQGELFGPSRRRLTSRQIGKRLGIPEATVRRVLSQKGPYQRRPKSRKK